MPPIAPVTLAALRRARDLIDRDYAEALDLDAMAREAGYSKYHFARSFAMAYGETPRAYLTRRRVERAKNLLRTANLSVTEVCFLVGLESLGSFMSSCSTRIGPSASTRSSLASRVRNDSILDDFRWLTVGPKEQPDLAILLAYPAPPMFSDEDAQTLRALVAKGALGGGVIETDDCRVTYAELVEKGVTFLQKPADRPYGVEALFRDDSGTGSASPSRSRSRRSCLRLLRDVDPGRGCPARSRADDGSRSRAIAEFRRRAGETDARSALP